MNFLNRFLKIHVSTEIKIVSGSKLFRADERTDGHTNIMTQIFAIRKFAKALKCPYKIQYICITPLFLIYYIFYSFVIWKYYYLCAFDITNILTELGKLYRYESSSANLRNVRWWRACDLLVWNSADTTRKKLGLLFLLAFGAHCVHNVYWALNQLRNNGPNSALSIFLPYPALCFEFFRKNLKRNF